MEADIRLRVSNKLQLPLKEKVSKYHLPGASSEHTQVNEADKAA